MDFVMTGDRAIKRMNELSANAVSVQEKLLTEILDRNCRTEYGRKNGFSEIRTVQEYQEAIPVSEYSDYEELIKRQIKGEERLMTADQAVFYCISSGSTDIPKYIPVTKADIMVQKTYLMDFITGSIRKEMPDVPENELFGKIFETGDFFRTFMPDGTMNGVRSGALHRFLESEKQFDETRYTAPKEVLFPDKIEDMLYVKLRFALAEKHVTAIHGVFVHKIVGMLRFLADHWQQLLADIATGGIHDCFEVSEEWKMYLKGHLPADPVRAAELRAISEKDTEGNKLLKIWPDIKYIRIVGGSIFESFMKELRRYTGEIPVHYYGYAASESVLGVAFGMNQEDAYYILIPEACFFEFLPEGQADRRPLTMGEIQAGRKYELLITTLSGFYRYAICDVVEVAGFFGQTPIVRLCYRKNQILNIADEKMNVRQLERAVHKFEDLTGIAVQGYCVDADESVQPAVYRIYLELLKGRLSDSAEEIMDHCLGESCIGYRYARQVREIGKTKITLLRKGSFMNYEKLLADQGRRIEQNKPLRIMRTQEQRDYFSICVEVDV